MEEDYDIQDEAYERVLQNDIVNDLSDRDVYSDIQLRNKLIEPDRQLSNNLANSNFQLGNISDDEYLTNKHEVSFALDCIEMPYEQGGFFLNEVGLKIMKRLDINHIMSGSIGAKKWDALTQDKKVNVLQKEEEKKKGIFNRR